MTSKSPNSNSAHVKKIACLINIWSPYVPYVYFWHLECNYFTACANMPKISSIQDSLHCTPKSKWTYILILYIKIDRLFFFRI